MEILKYHALALTIGYVLDLIFGDPHSLPHPVRLIGKLISFIENKTYKDRKSSGFILVVLVLFTVTASTSLIVITAYNLSIATGIIVEGIISFYCLATKSLKDESRAVYDALYTSGINEAREKLSMIVGRDTDNLDETEIIKASVETVAENTSDGVIAPLIFLTFFGPVGGMFYKAASTMDSMVGYKNDRYSQYGFLAAKLDDILNFIPSRISALLIIISSFLLCINGKGMYDGKRAFRVFKSDRFNHKSPNSAQSEAAYAGALGLKLAGGAYYFNKYVDKPYIGIETRKIEREDILRSHKILYVTSVLCEVLCTAAIFIIMKLNMIFL